MNRFTILRQQTTLESEKPRIWSWRFLFRVLVEIQLNQQEQIKLLKALNNKKLTVNLPGADDAGNGTAVEDSEASNG